MVILDQNYKPSFRWPLFDAFLQQLDKIPADSAGDDIKLRQPKFTVILAITPRVGSTALASALVKAGVTKQLGEWLNPRGPFQTEVDGSAIFSINQYLVQLLDKYTHDDLLVFKTAWEDFEPLVKNGIVDELFPHRQFVFIERMNKAAQAVSLYKARTSGFWHKIRAQDVSSQGGITLDKDFLLSNYHKILVGNDNWKNYFIQNRNQVLHITYESFENDILAAVSRICEILNIPSPIAADTEYQKLADNLSQVWSKALEQYLRGNYQLLIELSKLSEG